MIYRFHKKYSFYREDRKKKFLDMSVAIFSASTIKPMVEYHPNLMKKIEKNKILRENVDDIIGILIDNEAIPEGIFFTSKAIYVNSTHINRKKFRVRYDDILKLECNLYDNELIIITEYEDEKYRLKSKLWNMGTIKKFLEISSERYDYSPEEKQEISDFTLPRFKNKKIGELISGLTYGNVSNASTLYGEDKFLTPGGHGFSAERANHLFDKLTGKDAVILGDDNQKNGADRVVNDVQIQSKYWANGRDSVADCFKDGEFRYYNADGSPMQIEVPKDQYDVALLAMKDRIRNGEVSGVSNPEQAEKIIRKGHFTYAQVKNIAKAGTIESIRYDATNGAIISIGAFGITTLTSFATSIWNGESMDLALKNAVSNGLKIGGTSFLTAVLSGQLSKAGLNSLLVGSSEALIKVIGQKGSAVLVNAFRSGKNIYGAAAMKSAAKMLRGNIITGTVSVIVISSGDVINIFRSRVSGAQLLKNVATNGASAVGGTIGWVGGASIGATVGSVVPGVGNAIGVVVGGLAGALGAGTLAGKASESLLDLLIEDDANKMVKIIEEVFLVMVNDYLLIQREIEHIVDHLREKLTGKNLKEMYASHDKEYYAKNILSPFIQKEIKRREKIHPLDNQQVLWGLKLLLEDIADKNLMEATAVEEEKEA